MTATPLPRSPCTRHYSKVVVINDFIAMRMFNVPPLKVMQAFGESSRLAEKLYPQMLDRTIFCNCPWWFKTVVKVATTSAPHHRLLTSPSLFGRWPNLFSLRASSASSMYVRAPARARHPLTAARTCAII